MIETKTNTTNKFINMLMENVDLIPEPDHTFTYGDIYGSNYLGLRGVGGVYHFYDGDTLVYVGVSSDLGVRLSAHKKTKKKGVSTLIAKFMAEGLTLEEAKTYLESLTVTVIVEPVEAYQYIYEKVFIAKHSPKYNTLSKEGGRSNNKVYDIDEDKVIYEYKVLNMNMQEIADKLGCHRTTVSDILHKKGISTRNTNTGCIGITTEAVWELWSQGKNYSEIGAILNCAPSSVRYHVKKKEQQLETAGA